MTTPTATDANTLDEIKALFAPFLQKNPLAEIAEGRKSLEGRWLIRKPWGEDAIILIVPEDESAFAKTLNAIQLPSRFSAVWHKDSHDFEVIWTAFHPNNHIAEFFQRTFVFTYRGTDYVCEFGPSSERLLEISKAAAFVRTSATAYRNLQSFTMLEIDDELKAIGKPMSFWIRNVDLNEDDLLEYTHHLNFYMSYFDTDAPNIIIHAAADEKSVTPQTRYSAGVFPKTIRAKDIDINVLHFWSAAQSGDAARSFLYYYRILEYLAVYHLTSTARATLRKLLAKPNVLDDIPLVIEELVAATSLTKQEESQRLESLIRETVQLKLVWREIALNLETFTQPITFDGGFVLLPLIAKSATEDQFCQTGASSFAGKLRDLRNALSHGRDVRTAAVIGPTERNFALLQPWVHLIAVAAGEAIVYDDA